MGFCWRSLETAEAPPVADEARWFRGSVPIFTPQRGWKSADTTVQTVRRLIVGIRSLFAGFLFRSDGCFSFVGPVPPTAHFSQQLEKWAKEPFETEGFKTSFPVCKSYILTPADTGN